MRKLALHDYAWIGWPMFLGVLGVAGGTVGGLAFLINLRVMKSDLPLSRRYLATGACSLLAVAASAVVSRWLD